MDQKINGGWESEITSDRNVKPISKQEAQNSISDTDRPVISYHTIRINNMLKGGDRNYDIQGINGRVVEALMQSFGKYWTVKLHSDQRDGSYISFS